MEYRSQGIGSRLLRKIEDEARELGYSAVFLHIEAYNDGNFRFYDKMGYQKERVQLAKKLDNNFPKKDIIAKVKTWNYKDEDVKIQQVDSGFVFLNLAELASMYLENVLTHILMDSFSYQDAVKKMENLAAYLDEKKAYTYCYCIADKIAGIVWTYPYKFKEEERLYIGEIQVNAKYRGKKIGHHLYSKIIEKMEEMGIKTLYTHVDAINMASLGFHRTQGFEDEVYQMAKRVNLEKII